MHRQAASLHRAAGERGAQARSKTRPCDVRLLVFTVHTKSKTSSYRCKGGGIQVAPWPESLLRKFEERTIHVMT